MKVDVHIFENHCSVRTLFSANGIEILLTLFKVLRKSGLAILGCALLIMIAIEVLRNSTTGSQSLNTLVSN